MSLRKRMLRHGPRTGMLAASIGALIASGGVTSTAWGQDDDEDDQNNNEEDVIIVTGTRIRRDDFSAPNATTVVTADDMRTLGVTSVADMINQLPANVGSVTPETRPDSTFNLGASIADLRGLNLTTGSRTLTLVNSRRFVGSNSTGSVDLNMIPTALVGRIETVTGGASATYGADAMAGVVNVILDNNIEGVRVDMSYNTTSRSDGDNVNLSIGTGWELLDRRGQFTLGYDRSQQDEIGDCTKARELCRKSVRLFQNGETPLFSTYGRLTNKFFPDLPEYVLGEGFRYARVPQGWMSDPAGRQTDPLCATDPMNCNWNVGNYAFTEDGKDIVPIYDELPDAEREKIADAGEGPTATTPFGQGPLAYKGVPILPETTRDNLYTSFNYDFEGGTSLRAELTYGKTTSKAIQASARQSWWGWGCIFPDNAFLSPEWGASQAMRDLFAARMTADVPDPMAMTGGSGTCDPAPFLGSGYEDTSIYDYPMMGGTGGSNWGINKDVSDIVTRSNITDTKTTNFTLGANGRLFEGGSWTWDTYVQHGESERFVEVKNWQSSRRTEMSLHSVWDQNLNEPVCAIDSSNPSPEPGFATEGEYWESKWITYIERALDQAGEDPAEAQTYFDNLSGRVNGLLPCAPFNPFGHYTATRDAIDFAFPSIIDGNQNTQDSLSISFSGDIWQGYGPGPFRMAAGIDLRSDITDNGAPGGNGYTDRDFGLNFSDDWNGQVDTEEAFVEFDLPVLADKPGADSLTFNAAYRYTQNHTERTRGSVNLEQTSFDRDIESWKASMVWQPVDLMRVRITRSYDTRAPSAVELFQANRGSLSVNSGNERQSLFRYDIQGTPEDESQDDWVQYSGGGNPRLGEETSLTQTVGLVFEPNELLSGLQVSVDYYETHIKGGIQNVGANGVLQRCLAELQQNGYTLAGTEFCPNIEFGPPEPGDDYLMVDENGDPNPLYPNFIRINSVTSSSENAAPFTSRGVDISVNYDTQLAGGGLISARVIGTRALEQRVQTGDAVVPSLLGDSINVAGQTGSQGISSIWQWASAMFTDYSPTPKISGNAWLTYTKNAFSVTAQARYIGTGRLNNQSAWIGPGECKTIYPVFGPSPRMQCYDVDVGQTVSDPDLPSWTTWNLNFNYDFSRSRFELSRFESLSAYFNIENVGDRIPDFFSGTGAGGVNTVFFSLIGRQYRAGVRMKF